LSIADGAIATWPTMNYLQTGSTPLARITKFSLAQPLEGDSRKTEQGICQRAGSEEIFELP